MRKPTPINLLLKKLKEIKSNGATIYDIPDIQNACIDYMNETQKRDFEDLLYEMVEYERVMECIEYKAKDMDFWGVQNLMEGLEKDDRYKDNGECFENIDDDDVKDRLDEIIDLAKDIKAGK